MLSTEQIKTLGQALAHHRSWTLKTLGTYVANDGKFYGRLEEKGEVLPRTAKKVACWFDENWPLDLEWPSDIPRPSEQEDAA